MTKRQKWQCSNSHTGSPVGGSLMGDMRLGIIALVLYGVIAAIHTWLGYFPFGG